MKIDARMKTSSELVKIALAASNNTARLTLVNAKIKTTQELIQIALAGRGCVVFDFVEYLKDNYSKFIINMSNFIFHIY